MTTPSGWYHGEGDPPGTQRFWNGTEWVGEPVPQAAGGQPPPAHPGPGLGAGPATNANTLARLFSNSGRINRATYGLTVLAAIGVSILLAIVDNAVGTTDEQGNGVFGAIGAVAMLWPGIVTAVKRIHDWGASGWWVLLFFVPIANVVLFLMLLIRRGTTEPNKYGYQPRSGFGL